MALSNETFQPTHLRNRVQDFLKATDHMDSVGYAIQDTHASVLLRNMAQEDWTSVGLNLQMALTEVRTITWFTAQLYANRVAPTWEDSIMHCSNDGSREY